MFEHPWVAGRREVGESGGTAGWQSVREGGQEEEVNREEAERSRREEEGQDGQKGEGVGIKSAALGTRICRGAYSDLDWWIATISCRRTRAV